MPWFPAPAFDPTPRDLDAALARAVGRHAATPRDGDQPLLAHLVDLAAVVRALFLTRLSPPALRDWSRPRPNAHLDPDQLALLVATRGLDALCPSFQAGAPAAPTLQVLAAELPELLEQLGASRSGALATAAALAGHPIGADLALAPVADEAGGPAWASLREHAFHRLAALLGVRDLEPLVTPDDRWRFTLTGLATYASHLAADPAAFPRGRAADPDPERALGHALAAVAATWPRSAQPSAPPLRSSVRTSVSRSRSMGLVRWRSKPASLALSRASGPP